MNILIYVIATLAGLFLSYVGVVFAMLSGRQFAYIIGGLLAAAHIGTFVFVRRKAIQGKGREYAFVLALPIFIVLAAAQVFVLGRYVLLHAWPDSPEFTAECQNERIANDCRPALLRPVDSINPKSPLPSSQDVTLEILETKNYDPVWIFEGNSNTAADQWSKLAWDSERWDACKKFFRPADPNNPLLDGWHLFTNDPTGKKITVYNGNRICDANTIWMWDYVAERGRMVLIKVSPTGDVIYRISFEKPDEPMRFRGGIMYPTLIAKGGYVYFEWWNTNQSGRNMHIKRAMKVRFREPQATAPNTSFHRTSVPQARDLN